jgi:hypothetical protein
MMARPGGGPFVVLACTLTTAASWITAPDVTWRVPVSREAFIQSYISGLQLTEVAIVGAGRSARIITGEIPPGEPVACRYYFKASHAELLLMTIGKEDVTGKPASSLVDAIERTAAMLGATIQTTSELRKAAASAVDEITARVKLANQDGELKRVNYAYKVYRLEQLAKGEKAITYKAHLETFTASLVRQAAARMI